MGNLFAGRCQYMLKDCLPLPVLFLTCIPAVISICIFWIKANFNMQSQMGASVIFYPSSQRQLLTLLKDRVLRSTTFPRSKIQVGVSMHFNTVCGCDLKVGPFVSFLAPTCLGTSVLTPGRDGAVLQISLTPTPLSSASTNYVKSQSPGEVFVSLRACECS